MNDGTLDDLILTDPEPEGGKSKSVLALLAIVVVLIIIGAVLTKMIFSSPNDNNNTVAKTEIKKDVSSNIDTESNNIANNQNSNDTSSLDADLTPLDDNTMPSNVETIAINDKAKTDKSNIDTDNEVKTNKAENNLNLNTKQDEPIIKHNENKIKNITKSKVIHKPKTKHTTHTYGGHGNTYIQVGSFSKGPNEKFINKIVKSGFKYRIKEANGLRRVYVGPFTASEASRVLGKVKAKISPSAFIKK